MFLNFSNVHTAGNLSFSLSVCLFLFYNLCQPCIQSVSIHFCLPISISPDLSLCLPLFLSVCLPSCIFVFIDEECVRIQLYQQDQSMQILFIISSLLLLYIYIHHHHHHHYYCLFCCFVDVIIIVINVFVLFVICFPEKKSLKLMIG